MSGDLGGDPPCWAHLHDPEAPGPPVAPVVSDLGAIDISGHSGAVWSLPHGGDLDANLVRLHPGGHIDEHVNDQVDVLVLVQTGHGEIVIDGVAHPLRDDVVAFVPKGALRRIGAGPSGITYLSVHPRRGPLTITARTSAAGLRSGPGPRDADGG